jgi:hypothetical protein
MASGKGAIQIVRDILRGEGAKCHVKFSCFLNSNFNSLKVKSSLLESNQNVGFKCRKGGGSEKKCHVLFEWPQTQINRP